jgi:hypothetical protein
MSSTHTAGKKINMGSGWSCKTRRSATFQYADANKSVAKHAAPPGAHVRIGWPVKR